jgi:hypothetical protein
MRESDEGDGQTTVLLLAVIALVVMAVATAQFAGRVVARQQAQVAADAAALAGTIGGRPAADALATANHGVLVSFVVVGDSVQVVVTVEDASATARATRAP